MLCCVSIFLWKTFKMAGSDVFGGKYRTSLFFLLINLKIIPHRIFANYSIFLCYLKGFKFCQILSTYELSTIDELGGIWKLQYLTKFETPEIAQQDEKVSKNMAKYIFQTDKKKEQRRSIFFPRNIWPRHLECWTAEHNITKTDHTRHRWWWWC